MTAFGPPLPNIRTWPRNFADRRSATHTHQGLDFSAPRGTPVLAVAPGTVEVVRSAPGAGFSGYGRVVVLRFTDADGRVLRALYSHLDSVDVREGQDVAMGARLGTVGQSQFRTPDTVRRSRGSVPSGYRRELDDRGRYPARAGRPMSPHLHFELSTASYPQPSEAPTRIDPRAWAIARGVVGPAPTAPRETPPRLASRSTSANVRAPASAVESLRGDAVALVELTQARVLAATTALRASSAPLGGTAADMVERGWFASRSSLLRAIAAADMAGLERAASVWLSELATYGSRARQAGLAPLVEVVEDLRRRWDAARRRAAALVAGARAAVEAIPEAIERRARDAIAPWLTGGKLVLVLVAVLALSAGGRR